MTTRTGSFSPANVMQPRPRHRLGQVIDQMTVDAALAETPPPYPQRCGGVSAVVQLTRLRAMRTYRDSATAAADSLPVMQRRLPRPRPRLHRAKCSPSAGG